MEFKIGRIHLGKGIPTPASLFVEQKKCSQPNWTGNGIWTLAKNDKATCTKVHEWHQNKTKVDDVFLSEKTRELPTKNLLRGLPWRTKGKGRRFLKVLRCRHRGKPDVWGELFFCDDGFNLTIRKPWIISFFFPNEFFKTLTMCFLFLCFFVAVVAAVIVSLVFWSANHRFTIFFLLNSRAENLFARGKNSITESTSVITRWNRSSFNGRKISELSIHQKRHPAWEAFALWKDLNQDKYGWCFASMFGFKKNSVCSL